MCVCVCVCVGVCVCVILNYCTINTVTLLTVPCAVVNGQECYSYGYYDSINRDAFNFDYESQAYEGPVEICVNSEYESVCDIGWDQSDAQVVCRQLFGYNYGMCIVKTINLVYKKYGILQVH